MDSERSERIRYFGFAAFVGLLLLLNLTGVFQNHFRNRHRGHHHGAGRVSNLFQLDRRAARKRDFRGPGDLHRRDRGAGRSGEYLAAAEAMFIMLVGEGLEAYAAGRTSAAIHRFVEQMPRRARRDSRWRGAGSRRRIA